MEYLYLQLLVKINFITNVANNATSNFQGYESLGPNVSAILQIKTHLKDCVSLGRPHLEYAYNLGSIYSQRQ